MFSGLYCSSEFLLKLFCISVVSESVYFTRGLTALHASSEEVAEWTNKDGLGKSSSSKQNSHDENRYLQSQEATSSGSNISGPLSGEKSKYTFICECFFMTARVLNLGLLKAFSDFKHLVQVTEMLYLHTWMLYAWMFSVSSVSFLSELFFHHNSLHLI